MRVILDSNVIIAAYASHGLCHSLFELCLIGQTLILSEDILDEVAEKLQNRIKVPPKVVKEIRAFLKKNVLLERPVPVDPQACRDPDDLKILGLAKAATCDYLITGDQDLLTLGSFEGVAILSPRQFYDRLQKTQTD